MSVIRAARALLVGAVLSLGGIAGLSVATAADMPVKAPVPVVGASVPLDVHGYFDLTYRHQPRHWRWSAAVSIGNRAHAGRARVSRWTSIKIRPASLTASTSIGGVWNEYLGQLADQSWCPQLAGDGLVGRASMSASRSTGSSPPNTCSSTSQAPFRRRTNYVFTLGYRRQLIWAGWFPFNPYVTLFYNASETARPWCSASDGGTYRVDARHRADGFSCCKDRHVPADLGVPDVGHRRSVYVLEQARRHDQFLRHRPDRRRARRATSASLTTGVQAKWSLEKRHPEAARQLVLQGGRPLLPHRTTTRCWRLRSDPRASRRNVVHQRARATSSSARSASASASELPAAEADVSRVWSIPGRPRTRDVRLRIRERD